MIQVPNRLLEARQALEADKPVNWKRLADLQALDLVIAGRQFVEEAIRDHEAADERARAEFASKSSAR